MVVAVADDPCRRGQVVVEILAASGQSGEPVEDLEVLRVPLALEGVGEDQDLAG